MMMVEDRNLRNKIDLEEKLFVSRKIYPRNL